MSNDLQEVRDEQTLNKIKMQIQQVFPSYTTGIAWHLHRAWEYSDNFESGHPTLYHVEIENNYHMVVKGVLDYTRGLLYLDMNSIMMLVQERIDTVLSIYNAGHDPRYRGM